MSSLFAGLALLGADIVAVVQQLPGSIVDVREPSGAQQDTSIPPRHHDQDILSANQRQQLEQPPSCRAFPIIVIILQW